MNTQDRSCAIQRVPMFSRITLCLKIAGFLFLFTSSVLAWHPNRWAYLQWPYAYDAEQASWLYLNQNDTQYCLDTLSSQWLLWGQTSSPRSGWTYFSLPYAYSWNSSRWFYFNSGDVFYCVYLGSIRWTLFGQFDSNNRALINAAIGPGTTPNDQLTRTIPITVQTPYPGVTVGPAYTCGALGDTLYGAVEIRNNGNQILSFIRFGGIVYKNSSAVVVESNSFSYVSGSVGRTQGAIYTDTCLWPGEKGYLTFIETGINVEDVASMVIATVTTSSSVSWPWASVIPQTATYNSGTISVGFKNHGTGAAILESTGNRFILFDGNNRPLKWGFFSSTGITPPDHVLDVGETGSINATLFSFNGLSSTILPCFDFEDVLLPQSSARSGSTQTAQDPAPPANLSGDELAQYLLERHQAREEAKLNLLVR